MPINATQARQQQGAFQRKHRGLAAPSHIATCQQRYGRQPPGLNLQGASNQLALMLLLSTALPALAHRPAPATQAAHPPPRPASGWPPAAQAMDTGIELHDMRAAAAPAAAHDPLLGSAPTAVVNLATDAALATCLRHPRQCAPAVVTAAVTAAGVTAFWAAAATAGYLLHRDPVTADDAAEAPAPVTYPPLPRYRLDPQRLLPPMRFNVSDLEPGISPCVSLGAHVNRRWEETTTLQPSRTQLGTLDHLRTNALLVCQQLAEQMAIERTPDKPAKVIGDLWATGMDEVGIEVADRRPLQPALDAIEAVGDTDALIEYLFDASRRDANPLFTFTVRPDFEDPATNIGYFAQSGLGLPSSEWYDDPQKGRLIDAYRAHVVETLVLSGMPRSDADRLAPEILLIERELAAASVPFSKLATDISVFHNIVTPEQARQQTPNLDWRRFFHAQGLQPPATFSLGMPTFFQKLDTLLKDMPLETWRAYLRFHATDDAAPCLSTAFVDTHDAFHGGVIKGRRSRVPRFARILGMIQQAAGDAMGPAYAQVAFPADTARSLQTITQQLTSALKNRIAQCDWMDAETRERAMQKANTQRIEVGHPSQWPVWSDVGTGRNSFLENMQAVRAHAQRRNGAQLGQPADHHHWKLTPQTVNAYQDVSLNLIAIPAALLQPPFHDANADAALNYGGIGAIIGHEIAHGFDTVGTSFDERGHEGDWLTPYSRQQFDARADRLARQFSGYEGDGEAVDGELTLDENLADLGGLSIALQAMRQATAGTPDPMIDGKTREQRFFIAYAMARRAISTPQRAELDRAIDNHPPEPVRADGAPSNMREFSTAFNCTAGMAMARPADQQIRFL